MPGQWHRVRAHRNRAGTNHRTRARNRNSNRQRNRNRTGTSNRARARNPATATATARAPTTAPARTPNRNRNRAGTNNRTRARNPATATANARGPTTAPARAPAPTTAPATQPVHAHVRMMRMYKAATIAQSTPHGYLSPNIPDYIVVACAGCCSLLTNASECISDVSSWYRYQWPPVGYLSLWPSQPGGRRP